MNKEASTRDDTYIENVVKEKSELMQETDYEMGWVAVLVALKNEDRPICR
jgi:hypothetical protein